MSKILELAQSSAQSRQHNGPAHLSSETNTLYVALATEIQSEQDYTRAVLRERDHLRKAAQMALELLKLAQLYGPSLAYGNTDMPTCIEALREALK